MVINRTHLPWALLVAVITAGLGAVYLELFRPGAVPDLLPVPLSWGQLPAGHRSVGATPLGIVYGSLGLLLFLFAASLNLRKKKRHWRIGRAETWLRAHIWLSILTIPLILFHCGFHSGSFFTSGLLILYAIVMVSGFYGLALQRVLPRIMSARLPREVVYGEIDYLRERLVESAVALRERLAHADTWQGEGSRPPAGTVESTAAVRSQITLLRALDLEIIPYLRAHRRTRLQLRHRFIADNFFRDLKFNEPPELHPTIDQVQRWCDDHREMDLQITLQHWLHGWLFVHVPLSLLLIAWTLWHGVAGLFFY